MAFFVETRLETLVKLQRKIAFESGFTFEDMFAADNAIGKAVKTLEKIIKSKGEKRKKKGGKLRCLLQN